MNAHKSLKTVLVSSFLHEIHLAKTKLASEGIHSFIIDENINSIIGTAFIEGYKLNVDIADYEKARTILSLYKT
ncbi:MAG: DUF2007 domain-containing protein [Flavobacteriaceae bacterium]|nr:DUF2007 domain-containing protein [Flavobacteriaceae bacterium]